MVPRSVSPATLSKTILTDLVRNEMHYDGIIVTDALNMDAISQNSGETEPASVPSKPVLTFA